MSDKQFKRKRFYRSHIFRIIVGAACLFSTVFFPFVFAYPNVDGVMRIVVISCVVAASIAEITVFAVITHFCVYSRIERSSEYLNDMAHGGILQNVEERAIDNTASDVISAVNATVDEYARLEQVRKSFVANASHELRSPLTSVQGFLQAALDGTVDVADREKYLEIALSETKRLNGLISSMLDLSRLDSGKNPLVMTKFNINDVINDVVSKFEPTLVKKSIQTNTDYFAPTCYVFADKDKVIQVVTNLIDNAIKYSPVYSRIEILTEAHENKVHITVRDFGYGISKRDQMLIWDRFYMTDKSRSPVKTKGSGLGLSIVKKIIDEHDEVIWVESSRGAGAKFIFTLTLFDPNKHKVSTGNVIKTADTVSSAITEIE